MRDYKSERKYYRTRTVRSITRTVQPIVSKHLIDFRTDDGDTPTRKQKATWLRNSLRLMDTVLDRIINKLRQNSEPQDVLLMITPASKHANLYKLHVIQRHGQGHLGMTSITHGELSRLKASKAFQKYCIVFGSRYIDLKHVVLQTETIKSLVNCLNRACCAESNESEPSQNNLMNASKSNTSSAGDYFKNETVKIVKCQDINIQTDPEKLDNISFSLTDVYSLIETINQTLQPSKSDIDRFFFMADNLNFSLVLRPELLWKTSAVVYKDQNNVANVMIESYLPGNCYLGSVTLLESDVLQALDLYPKLLFSIHVIEDVYEIIPLPPKFIRILKRILVFLKLELLYDALGELIFDWYKNFTFL